jgi:TPR repeat protein
MKRLVLAITVGLAACAGQSELDAVPDTGARGALGREIAAERRLAEAGDLATQAWLGVRLSRSPIRELAEEGARWNRLAAERGDIDAQRHLAAQYLRGHGLEHDRNKAVHWYAEAAHQGDPLALNQLSELEDEDPGSSPDFDALVGWFTARAEGGDGSAMYGVGRLYLHGFGVEPDPKRGLRWLEAAARQGYIAAWMELAMAHGRGAVVLVNTAESDRWLRLYAAKMGPEEAAEFHLLGFLSPDRAPDPAAAIPWYEAAAAGGNAKSLAQLSAIHREGDGVPADHDKAFAYFSRAAAAGVTAGHVGLAEMHLLGEGRPKDVAAARRHLRIAAEAGDTTAMERLAGLHRDGIGTPVDPHQALRWLRTAAERQSTFVPRRMGDLYRDGDLGDPEWRTKALGWYLVGAIFGDPTADTRAWRLALHLTPAEWARSRHRAEEFLDGFPY